MNEKYGQAIGGIKSQQKILRGQVKEQSEAFKALQDQFAAFRREQELDTRKLKSNMLLLVCMHLVFYATLFTIYCARHYG